MRDTVALAVLLGVDEVGEPTERVGRLRLLLRNVYVPLLLAEHNKFHAVERVGSEVGVEAGSARNRVGLDREGLAYQRFEAGLYFFVAHLLCSFRLDLLGLWVKPQ